MAWTSGSSVHLLVPCKDRPLEAKATVLFSNFTQTLEEVLPNSPVSVLRIDEKVLKV